MQALGAAARAETTIDVDILLEPERDEVLRELPRLADEPHVNVELGSPADLVPLPAGWRARSPLVAREGKIAFRRFDPTSQALERLERGHERDLADVEALLAAGLVERSALGSACDEIEPALYRFPAVDPRAFRARVAEAVR